MTDDMTKECSKSEGSFNQNRSDEVNQINGLALFI